MCKSLGAYSVGQMLLYMTNRELMDHSSGASVPVLTSPDPANLEHLVVQDPLVFWTMSLVLVSFCWALSAHFYGFQMMRVGLHVRVGCSYLMYRKSLKLQESSQTTMGKMVSSNSDCSRSNSRLSDCSVVYLQFSYSQQLRREVPLEMWLRI